ncbi:MAG: hypothetical protein JO269_09485 [Burkholderiaceae bacterium]|nr:hypothetical protein [Burkholderiaceae bacterium]
MKTLATSTSIEAYHSHVACGKASAQCQCIVAFITERGGDWSIGEIAHALGLEKSTASARIFELLETGNLVACKHRKDKRSGITVRPVGLPAVGQQQLFQ